MLGIRPSYHYYSHILYGLFPAKSAVIKEDRCFLVEGYTDVISLHQAGIENVVASSGTALTSEQVRLIKRFTKNVTVLYDGDEAGIKSAAYKISGHNAYGWLKSESGVHRLVRISPFDSQAKRHTSFTSVKVYPVVDDNIEIEVNPSDIRLDTYRSSGAGGQHVNTTDSAVRITHLPTGIVVTSSEKSQHQNRDIAMKALKSRLYQMELDKRSALVNEAHENAGDAGWGNQIRSYVLQPYQMVKDHRINMEVGNINSVLDGQLDMFIDGVLLAGSD